MSGASGAVGCVSGRAGTPPTHSLRRAAVHGNGAVAEGTARSKARRRSAGLRVEQAPRRARRAGTRGRTPRQRPRPRLGLAAASRAPPAGPCATSQGAHFRGPLSANDRAERPAALQGQAPRGTSRAAGPLQHLVRAVRHAPGCGARAQVVPIGTAARSTPPILGRSLGSGERRARFRSRRRRLPAPHRRGRARVSGRGTTGPHVQRPQHGGLAGRPFSKSLLHRQAAR